jgi:large subunit ribosomal protein L35e
LTVVNQRNKQKVREEYAKKSKKPVDLRAKKTRALRRKMTKSQLNKKTIRKQKQEKNFGLRKFALRA